MERMQGRTVTVHLTHRGDYLGTVGPFEVDEGWWSSVGPVVQHTTAEVGVPVAVSRLAAAEGGDGGSGGHVTYHAEALRQPADRTPRRPDAAVAALLGPAERRSGWATPEGLRAALDWAEAALAAVGRPAVGDVRQVRTWNLSGLFRYATGQGDAWLKATNPAFNAAEADAIALLAGADVALAPTVLAADSERGLLLLDHIPGDDCWGPSAETVADVVPRLVAAQAALAADGRAAGARLRRRTLSDLVAQVGALLDGEAGTELTPAELADARALADRLPALVAELDACGLPDTLVHGDLHPGNWRSDGRSAVVVDYADSYYGHPVFDGLRPRDYVSDACWEQFAGLWVAAWAEHVPGSDPARALALAQPLYHLAFAVRYQEFLDHIEISERPYHEGDPAREIRAALACAPAADASPAVDAVATDAAPVAP
ncbi:phosphotransferase [Kitasatospora sp. NPDC054939]